MAKELIEELSLAWEKSFEMERLLDEDKEEKAKLLTRCDELESEAHMQAECAREILLEVMKKIKEDYLTSEEF